MVRLGFGVLTPCARIPAPLETTATESTTWCAENKPELAGKLTDDGSEVPVGFEVRAAACGWSGKTPRDPSTTTQQQQLQQQQQRRSRRCHGAAWRFVSWRKHKSRCTRRVTALSAHRGGQSPTGCSQTRKTSSGESTFKKESSTVSPLDGGASPSTV